MNPNFSHCLHEAIGKRLNVEISRNLQWQPLEQLRSKATEKFIHFEIVAQINEQNSTQTSPSSVLPVLS